MLAEELRKTGHYKIVFTSGMEKTIKDKLENYQCSPEQIVGCCKTRNIKMVSHEPKLKFVLKDKRVGSLFFNYL
jgi:hypothetical protein